MQSAEAFLVQGGHRLQGSITPQGAKNEALQILCACLLTEEEVRISNLPDILDVRKLLKLLEGLGVTIVWASPNEVVLCARNIDLDYTATEEYQKHARSIRGSVMLLGVLLGRFRRAFIPRPGGDKIGRRRIDTHLNGFQELGAEIQYEDSSDTYFLSGDKLRGGYLLMDEISVTGTANIIMAAVLAPGKTTIYNAACEPYVQQLCRMLVSMGADIKGIGSNMLHIEGVERLQGTIHRILPDMIEIGSFIGMAAMTKSNIRIRDCAINELGIIPSVFQKLGIIMEYAGDDILVHGAEKYAIQTFIDGSIMTIYDAPWPGFTPDLISIIVVTATQASGSVLVHQKMFESRLFFVDKLIDMGAQIILCDPHRATVIGMNRKQALRGISMTSPDIRAGVALLIAAMSAEGESVIHNIQQIDRGYENIDLRLNDIGAHIQRVGV